MSDDVSMRPEPSPRDDVAVREATAADAEAVAALHIAGWQAYRGLLPDAHLDDPALAEGCHERWRGQLARPAESRATRVRVAVLRTGADRGDRVVGFVRFGPTADAGVDGDEIWDLWVDPEHRSHGVGAALLADALERCRRPVVVWVLAANARGRAFYGREGAVDDGLTRHEHVDEHGGFTISDVRMRWVG